MARYNIVIWGLTEIPDRLSRVNIIKQLLD